jgi:hypothetical protein
LKEFIEYVEGGGLRKVAQSAESAATSAGVAASVADSKAESAALRIEGVTEYLDPVLELMHFDFELRLDQSSNLQQEIEESLNRETSEDDTHPSPKRSFSLDAQNRRSERVASHRDGLGFVQESRSLDE